MRPDDLLSTVATPAAIVIAGFMIARAITRGSEKMSETLDQVTQDVITATQAVVSDAAVVLQELADALSNGGAGDNSDAIAKLQGVASSLNDLDAKLKAAITPVATAITISPTSITLPGDGSQVSGTFSASGGTGPYNFSASNASGDIAVNPDGSYTVTSAGSVDLTATDSTGKASDPQTVTVA